MNTVKRCNEVLSSSVAISAIKIVTKVMALTAALFFSMNFVQAASVRYIMDQSNLLSDGVDYLQVTIDDEGVAGNINFTVETLGALDSMAQEKYGLDLFAFNSQIELEDSSISGLQKKWSFDESGNISEYGVFSYEIKTDDKKSLTSILNFSITGVDGDVINDYILYSVFSGDEEGESEEEDRDDDSEEGDNKEHSENGTRELSEIFFAAHVKGFKITGDPEVESAFFAGGMKPVPLPAAVWLFLSGIIGLTGFSLKNKKRG